ncbi:beta-1,3-galactosyl-O-glycosyl-glycoprotein beta-1,6-N-acetylglucosaminyltransferase 4-like [Betta splendens]|uniref:Beta-1,3-galactosyl-O-glycosyl-glycoprotein beta-1,6-N-acetylglucosaminyltransferase 4-like n=1 Tax=Betta splendens TaxID=158456 RepID=A0A6P7P538_BETSP|nr:beta-1,3-galactosyl-O-glycosyl-glycoprotein beta-1,6-N-acetylglucosaminyltransferase 4-like [Betta splendens]XP_029025171.1 beta-1,3-galactosyl-O-glycosyl-glycoprotein beta-1,6-N-acetylglucosaminyltransferase 4-like [Betta splendens]
MKSKGLSLQMGRRQICRFILPVLAFCLLLLICVKYRDVPRGLHPPPPLLDVKTVQKYSIDCSAIYDLDPVEVYKSLIIRQKHIVKDNDENLLRLTSNCSLFRKVRGFDDVCVSEEEKDFPIAYSLVVHKYPWMVERLIRATYSPSNIYCIHYDLKSPAQFVAAMEGLAHCLPNVFIASKLEDVIYAGFTRLKADLNCLTDLLSSEVKWKYVINLCGQDFPLRPNNELVSELKKLNGSNMVHTYRPPQYMKNRYAFHYEVRDAYFEYKKTAVQTSKRKAPPPHNIEMFTGSAYFVLSRDFVLYIDSSVVVKDLLAWSEDTYSPDEHFWATIVRLPGVPGEVPRSHPDITDLMSRTRLVKWSQLEGSYYAPCTGIYVRAVCVYGAGDIHWLLNYGSWFANKFDTNVDPIAVQCLEENLSERKNLFYSIASPDCFKG